MRVFSLVKRSPELSAKENRMKEKKLEVEFKYEENARLRFFQKKQMLLNETIDRMRKVLRVLEDDLEYVEAQVVNEINKGSG